MEYKTEGLWVTNVIADCKGTDCGELVPHLTSCPYLQATTRTLPKLLVIPHWVLREVEIEETKIPFRGSCLPQPCRPLRNS